VEVVNGVGNKRGEVEFDPSDPLVASLRLGAGIFELHHTDYNIDSARPNAVWPRARESAEDEAITPYADL